MRLRSRGITSAGACGAAVCAVAVAFPAEANPWWPAQTPADAAARHVPTLHYRDGPSTGPAFDAYYGVVQVQAVIRGGRIAAVNVLRHPSHSGTSRAINSQALPLLEREVIRAQSADVDAISGATLTSRAFIQSMSEALRRASG